MKWLKVEIKTEEEQLEFVQAILYMNGIEQMEVKDNSLHLTDDGVYWDYIEDTATMQLEYASILYYVEDTKTNNELLTSLREQLIELATIETTQVDASVFAVDYKKFFRPIKIGGVTIVAPWLKYKPSKDETLVVIDPHLAFGTGEHATTKMCISLIDDMRSSLKNKTVLDIGAGSGILAFTALKLGAASAKLYDIDSLAVIESIKNTKLNGLLNQCKIVKQNFLEQNGNLNVDIIFANIVAGVLIPLAGKIKAMLSQGGIVILSGIIEHKLNEVIEAYEKESFTVSKKLKDGEWFALELRIK